jgi:hypothetical protein
MKKAPIVSKRQQSYEDSCRLIANDLLTAVRKLPLPDSLLAFGNVSDMFDCIRTAYNNGRADERDGVTS